MWQELLSPGVPSHLQWEVVAVPSLPFQWVRRSIRFPWAFALGRALSPAWAGCWCREFSPAAGTKAAQTADVDSKSLSFPLPGQAPGRIWFTTRLTCIYEQEKSSHSLGITVFVKNVRGVFMSPITVFPPLREPSQKHHFFGLLLLQTRTYYSSLQVDKEKRDFTCDCTSRVYLKGSPTQCG